MGALGASTSAHNIILNSIHIDACGQDHFTRNGMTYMIIFTDGNLMKLHILLIEKKKKRLWTLVCETNADNSPNRRIKNGLVKVASTPQLNFNISVLH